MRRGAISLTGSLALWLRSDRPGHVEPWIVSSSLDSTLRRWKLADLVTPPAPVVAVKPKLKLSEEDEAELAELMDI